MTPLCRGIFSSGKLSDIDTTISVNTANLNGTSQYFDAGTSINYGSDVDFFTCIRFKINSLASIAYIFTNSDATAADIWRIRVQTNGTLEFFTGNPGFAEVNTASSSINISTGIWYSVVAGIDTASNEVFVSVNNETPVTTAQTFTFDNSGYKTLVGSVALGGQWLDGSVAFAGTGRGVLSAGERAELTASSTLATCYDDLTNGLKLKFEDNGAFWDLSNWVNHTGQELTDQTDNGNNLTNINSTPFTGTGLSIDCLTLFAPVAGYNWGDATAITPGAGANDVLGWADYIGSNDLSQVVAAAQPLFNTDHIEFDGTDKLEDLDPQAGDFTYIIKFKSTSNAIQVLLGSTLSSVSERITLTGGSIRYKPSSASDYSVALNYNGTGPHIYTVTRSGSDITMYLEGVEESSAVDGSSITLDIVGDRSGTTLPFIGNMYKLLVYDKALSPAEVLQQVELL